MKYAFAIPLNWDNTPRNNEVETLLDRRSLFLAVYSTMCCSMAFAQENSDPLVDEIIDEVLSGRIFILDYPNSHGRYIVSPNGNAVGIWIVDTQTGAAKICVPTGTSAPYIAVCSEFTK